MLKMRCAAIKIWTKAYIMSNMKYANIVQTNRFEDREKIAIASTMFDV